MPPYAPPTRAIALYDAEHVGIAASGLFVVVRAENAIPPLLPPFFAFSSDASTAQPYTRSDINRYPQVT